MRCGCIDRRQGESLYAISRKFYGTPHAWRLIYDRNHLTSVTLTGDEILIIPERGRRDRGEAVLPRLPGDPAGRARHVR
jgi:hypothetical protein